MEGNSKIAHFRANEVVSENFHFPSFEGAEIANSLDAPVGNYFKLNPHT